MINEIVKSDTTMNFKTSCFLLTIFELITFNLFSLGIMKQNSVRKGIKIIQIKKIDFKYSLVSKEE